MLTRRERDVSRVKNCSGERKLKIVKILIYPLRLPPFSHDKDEIAFFLYFKTSFLSRICRSFFCLPLKISYTLTTELRRSYWKKSFQYSSPSFAWLFPFWCTCYTDYIYMHEFSSPSYIFRERSAHMELHLRPQESLKKRERDVWNEEKTFNISLCTR